MPQPAGRLIDNRTFVALAIGQTCSNVGQFMSMFAVALAIKTLTDSDLQVGLVALVRAAPLLGLSLLGGSLADRIDRRRVLQVTQPAAGLLLAVLAAAFALDLPFAVALCYAVTFAVGLVGAFDVPSIQASVPTIVGRVHLVQALSVLTLSRQVGSVLAPSLAGVLIGQAGFGVAFAVAALWYAVFTAILPFLRWASQPTGPRSTVGASIVEGLRYAWATPVILGVLLMDFVATTFAQPSAFVVIFGTDVLRLDATRIGLLAGGYPLGAIVGGVALTLFSRRIPVTVRTIVTVTAIYGAGIAVFGLSTSFVLSFGALVAMGLADVIGETLRATLLQLTVPDELRGRISSLMLIFTRGGPSLGQFRAGALASLAGPVFSAVSGGLLCIAGTLLIGGWLGRRYRSLLPETRT